MSEIIAELLRIRVPTTSSGQRSTIYCEISSERFTLWATAFCLLILGSSKIRNKSERVKLENPAYGAEILRMEALMGEQELYIRELQESIDAGYHALDAATAVLLELDDAENIAMMDVFLNGGLLAAFAKRSRLERAQQKLEVLQAQLRSFKTELADVKFDADLQKYKIEYCKTHSFVQTKGCPITASALI